MNIRIKLPRIGLALALAALIVSSCARQAPEYLSHKDWAPDVRTALNDFIDTYKGTENAYAVFDFDNTCSIFDISEQMIPLQVKDMCFNLDPEEFHDMVFNGMEGLTPEVAAVMQSISDRYRRLYLDYGPFSYKGLTPEVAARIAEDPVWKDFAVDMCNMYDVLQDCLDPERAYRWNAGWFAGMTEQELYDMAARSHRTYSEMETRMSTWTGSNGSFSWIDGIQVSPNIHELWKALTDNGIDVWVCSASYVQPVMAAVDVFGLHDLCKGVIAMTLKTGEDGRFTVDYDYETGYAAIPQADGTWVKDTIPTRTQVYEQGKVTAIRNVLYPKYGMGPLAGFMDSTGDYFFCTEFDSMKLAVCFNRASRKVTEGGGLIAMTAIYERDALGYDLRKADANGDILYVLQGRDENGMRSLRPSNSTLRYGETQEKLFYNEDNFTELEYFKKQKLSVSEILNTFCISTPADSSPMGFDYGFTSTYPGYKSIK